MTYKRVMPVSPSGSACVSSGSAPAGFAPSGFAPSGSAPPRKIAFPELPTVKPRPSKIAIVWKWIKGLGCGSVSAVTCCLCCGCCGKLPAPDVFYDENDADFRELPEGDRKGLRVLQWVSLSGLCCRYGSSCGCCCGCCGHITPGEMVVCGESMRKQKYSRH